MQKVVIFLLLLWLPIGAVFPSKNAEDNAPLLISFRMLQQDKALQHANWTVYVKNITTGEPVLAHNIRQPLVPASTQKLLTTSSALLILGHDFRFATTLQHDGHVDLQGVLHGNLYVKGGGDPSLGAAMLDDSLSMNLLFARWREALSSAGIKKISGHIVADERVYDDQITPPR